MRHALLALALLSTPFAAQADDEVFANKVCALLPAPVLGSVTFGSGDGCSWGLADKDGVTIETEEAGATATFGLGEEQLKSLYDTMVESYKASEESAQGLLKVEALPVCDGGLMMHDKGLNDGVPTTNGFYRCRNVLVMVNTRGAQLDPEFGELTRNMMTLVQER